MISNDAFLTMKAQQMSTFAQQQRCMPNSIAGTNWTELDSPCALHLKSSSIDLPLRAKRVSENAAEIGYQAIAFTPTKISYKDCCKAHR